MGAEADATELADEQNKLDELVEESDGERWSRNLPDVATCWNWNWLS